MEEIYFNQELADVCFEVDALEEWKQTCEELGMESQLLLTKGKDSPIPYPYINQIMFNVYDTICPTHVDYKKYNKTPVPLKILKQIAFSVKEHHFQRIEIWYNDKHPDPIVVGVGGYYFLREESSWTRLKDDNGKELKFANEEDAESYKKEMGIKNSIEFEESNKYLIARWGDELKSFDQLKEQAHKTLIESVAGILAREIKEKQVKLDAIKENVTCFLNGDIPKYQIQ